MHTQLIKIEWPCPRARVRCGPREQRERDRGDELEHFYHKSQQLGSAHSIFSKTPGGAAAISSAKAAFAQIELATDSPLEGRVTSELVSEVDSGARKNQNQIFRGFWMIPASENAVSLEKSTR